MPHRNLKWIIFAVAIVALSGLANLANTLLAVQSTAQDGGSSSLTIIAFAAFVSGTLALIVIEARNYFQGRAEVENAQQVAKEKYDQLMENYNRLVLTDLLRIARNAIAHDPDSTRACIFLYDEEKDELYMYQGSGQFDEDEEKQRFARNEGAVGLAFWYEGQPTLVDLHNASIYELTRLLRLQAEHIPATRQLKTILAVPIPSPDDQNYLIGVLSIDSTGEVEESGLGEEMIVDKYTNLAETQLHRYIDERLYGRSPRPQPPDLNEDDY